MKKDHPDRMYHYNKLKENENLIKWDGVLEFPASNEDIDAFEDINDGAKPVNVYDIDHSSTNSIVLISENTKIKIHHVMLISC